VLAARVPARWVTGDSVYGDDRRLQLGLEAQPHAYVVAVSGKEDVRLDWHQRQVKTVLAGVPEDGWSRLSAGNGSTGPHGYDWRWLPLAAPLPPGWCRWRLVRRRISAPRALQADVVFAPQGTLLDAVVRVSGTRWSIERGFEAAQGAGGLDQSAARSWLGWYRHITRDLWALALLAIWRARAVALELLKKTLRPSQEPSRLAAFKASRGLRCP
jgi:SRSO17 transposase